MLGALGWDCRIDVRWCWVDSTLDIGVGCFFCDRAPNGLGCFWSCEESKLGGSVEDGE
jgi:hypothetical protein